MVTAGLRVGYACVHTRLPSPARTTRLANASPERLRELTAANLDALEEILRWNAAHGIQVFRVTSNLVPFASHPANPTRWWEDFAGRFAELAALVREEAIRLSTHPGPYTVLGSASRPVVDAAVSELTYHATMLGALGLDRSHKIVVHATGHADRFAAGFERLPEETRARLAVENDERWSLEDALALSERLEVPAVLDVFHHELNPSHDGLGTRELALLAASTWRPEDGRPEVHFSTQQPGKRPGAHADSLDEAAFREFAESVGYLPLDCIVEVKDKERSALRAAEILAAVGV